MDKLDQKFNVLDSKKGVASRHNLIKSAKGGHRHWTLEIGNWKLIPLSLSLCLLSSFANAATLDSPTISSGGALDLTNGATHLQDIKGQSVIGVVEGGGIKLEIGGIYGFLDALQSGQWEFIKLANKTGINTFSIPFIDPGVQPTDPMADQPRGTRNEQGGTADISTVRGMVEEINRQITPSRVTVFCWYDESVNKFKGLTAIKTEVYNPGGTFKIDQLSPEDRALLDLPILADQPYQITIKTPDPTSNFSKTFALAGNRERRGQEGQSTPRTYRLKIDVYNDFVIPFINQNERGQAGENTDMIVSVSRDMTDPLTLTNVGTLIDGLNRFHFNVQAFGWYDAGTAQYVGIRKEGNVWVAAAGQNSAGMAYTADEIRLLKIKTGVPYQVKVGNGGNITLYGYK